MFVVGHLCGTQVHSSVGRSQHFLSPGAGLPTFQESRTPFQDGRTA